MDSAILADNLVKTFKGVRALDNLDLQVRAGSIFGLLGPNGAGKTTSVRLFTTLLRPDSGTALVGGFDVQREPAAVRRIIGLSGQYSAVDESLTGRQNLDMVGRLYHLSRVDARRRAVELLESFDLVEAADRAARTYSGGMRRRLDLAAALVARPRVIFLDEPTTGLDPRSRLMLWDVIAQCAHDGATVLLTTQYLEEADRLAEFIAVVDAGKVIASGTPGELKTKVGGGRLQVVLQRSEQLGAATAILGRLAGVQPICDAGAGVLSVPTEDRRLLVVAVRELDSVGVRIDDIAMRRPTLDDVFLALTGHAPAETEEPLEITAGVVR